MVNHDTPHQLRDGRDKVGPALPERLRIIDQPQVGFVENDGGLQGVAGAFPAHVMVGEPVQFGLHQRKQLLERSFVSAAPVAEQLGNLLSRRWGRRHTGCSTPQILTRIDGFLQHSRRPSKKTAHSWRVSGGLSALPDEPAQTTNAGKTKTESKPQKKMKGSYQMKKMKKVCAVLCAVLSVLFLASAFAGQDNFVRWDQIVGVITALNVDNPVC